MDKISPEEKIQWMKKILQKKESTYVCDTSAFLWNAIQEGKEILLEGQLGSLKDPDHGIYPMEIGRAHV